MITHHELRDESNETVLAKLLEGQKLLTVYTTTTIRDAANRMIESDFQHVPVVSPSNPKKLLGWLTLNDIARQQNASDS